ncbi:hypothetical protein ACFW16_25405 [Inquilinus sp. NPDC058860]|uniref:hypothetical protein n=1 Tax=Inquilinus sp. NPDC058860 TaxID=3346652 RepID=UPI00368E747A
MADPRVSERARVEARAAITRTLIAGFTIVAVEADWPGTLDQALRQAVLWFRRHLAGDDR